MPLWAAATCSNNTAEEASSGRDWLKRSLTGRNIAGNPARRAGDDASIHRSSRLENLVNGSANFLTSQAGRFAKCQCHRDVNPDNSHAASRLGFRDRQKLNTCWGEELSACGSWHNLFV